MRNNQETQPFRLIRNCAIVVQIEKAKTLTICFKDY